MKEVIPPAIAAFDSDCIDALWVNPGSLKCTWSSIIPGKRNKPSAFISSAFLFEIVFEIFSILSPLINTSATNIFPSLTI